MRVSQEGARRMDWDELLWEIPVIGRDFEVLLPIENLELLRGPMGSITRAGDDVRVQPELLVRQWVGHAPEFMEIREGSGFVRVGLVDHHALLLPDTSIVIVDRAMSPVHRLCVPGDNVLASSRFGHIASD